MADVRPAHFDICQRFSLNDCLPLVHFPLSERPLIVLSPIVIFMAASLDDRNKIEILTSGAGFEEIRFRRSVRFGSRFHCRSNGGAHNVFEPPNRGRKRDSRQ